MRSARKTLGACLGLALLLGTLFAPSAAGFGIKSFSVQSLNKGGEPELRAGAHPYEFKVDLVMDQNSEGRPEGTLRQLIVELPPGFSGNPQATERCSGADFEGQFPHCPITSQVGVAHASVVGIEEQPVVPVFNLEPTLGLPARVGFSVVNVNSFQELTVRTGGDYGITASDITLPTDFEIQSVTQAIWGVPADPEHDEERGDCLELGGKCKTDAVPAPFISLPTSCTGPLRTTIRVDSLEEPGNTKTASSELLGKGGAPVGLNSCAAPPFNPTISAQPETTTSDSPTGLHFNLNLPQVEDPEGLATAHLKDTVVTLPEGLVLNPSSGDGLGACSLAQIDLQGAGPAQCPANSKVGNVKVETPALDHPVQGSVYIARQGENPFNSTFAIYVALDDPLSGVVVKLAGKVEPDPLTGRLKTTFEDNPQLPFENFDFDFFGGPRAALTTPPTCGTSQTTAQLTPWTSPERPDVTRQSPLQITSAPGGGPCPASEAQMPNAPSFEAGSATPIAGAYSPFVVKLSRENGSQRFGALNMTLPPGLAANFTGVAECSDAQIAQAAARLHPGEGALEQRSPSCPASSQLGTVNVGAGSGNPIYVQGSVYLAGPYKGAPFSLAIITPGVAGPFDVGTVVSRAALYVNEETGQGTVKSDPLPTILAGIPLDVRSIAVKIDRSGYVLNPTSCEAKAITGELISTTGQVAQLRNRFQVGGCKGLDYTPDLSLTFKGSTKRSGHPALRSVLTQPSGQANSRRLVVILPATEFIDPIRTANPCTRPQFAAGNCPPASVLGKARAFTPLLAKPLEGPVYFRANGGARELPDIVADLRGRIHVVLVGFVDAAHHKGSETSRVRTTFANLPDAPVTKAIVELKGGKKGTLVNSANLCKVPPIATVKMTAQNSKTQVSEQRIGTGCGR